MTTGAPVSRRAVLTSAAVLVGAAALGAVGVMADVLPGSPGIRLRLGLDGPDGTIPSVPAGTVTTRRLPSAARGTDVDLVTMVPDGVGAAGLPVLLALHGRGASARAFVDLGLPQLLTAATRAGTPPFAIAAVDGSPYYWHARDDDDPQAMLRDEGPGWLADAGSRNVFTDQADWEAAEPLRHLDEIDGSTLGVWCGTEDPFLSVARQLARGAGATEAHFDSGAHTDGYWRRVLPEALAFVGTAFG